MGRTLANGTYTKGGIGEDCLNVNVFTPAGVTNTSGLPVVVWCEYDVASLATGEEWEGGGREVWRGGVRSETRRG